MGTYELSSWIFVAKSECDHSFPLGITFYDFANFNFTPLPPSQCSEKKAELGLLTMKDVTIEAGKSVVFEV